MTYPSDKRCPCGTGLEYRSCCRPYHDGRPAPTAETLMRSRYSAFVTGDEDYLLDTWDPQTRPASLSLQDMPVRFYRLDILRVSGGGLLDDHGVVEFEAFYRGADTGSQTELSQFRRAGSRWFYSSGTVS